jgi:hypothetical protein
MLLASSFTVTWPDAGVKRYRHFHLHGATGTGDKPE